MNSHNWFQQWDEGIGGYLQPCRVAHIQRDDQTFRLTETDPPRTSTESHGPMLALVSWLATGAVPEKGIARTSAGTRR